MAVFLMARYHAYPVGATLAVARNAEAIRDMIGG